MQNLSNFVSLPWKFHNPYCHNGYFYFFWKLQYPALQWTFSKDPRDPYGKRMSNETLEQVNRMWKVRFNLRSIFKSWFLALLTLIKTYLIYRTKPPVHWRKTFCMCLQKILSLTVQGFCEVRIHTFTIILCFKPCHWLNFSCKVEASIFWFDLEIFHYIRGAQYVHWEVAQELFNSKYHNFLAFFPVANSKISQIAQFFG